MNDILNLNRFALSFRRLMIERGVKMFGSILVLIIIATLFMNLQFNPGFYSEARTIMLVMCVMFGPIIYMSVVASEFTDQSKGISYLLMPNSTFEKWLLNNVVVIALYFIVFALLFRIVDIWMIGRLVESFQLPSDTLKVVAFNSDVFITSLLTGATIGLGILLGSHYFNKNNLVISPLIMFVAFIAIIVIDYFAANIIFEPYVELFESAPFGSVSINDAQSAGGRYFISNNMEVNELARWVFIPIFSVLSLIYFVRIKEKQL